MDSKKIFLALTSMRGVAALMVAFYHLRYGFVPVPDFNLFIFRFRFGEKGYLWVDFFFILSGFILAHRYAASCSRLNGRVYFHFLWRRFARIWPLHLVTLVVAICYLAIKHGSGFLRLDAIMANFFLVHGWGHLFLPSFDFPSWSLSSEWGAYLLLPLVIFATGRYKNPMLQAGLILGAFVALIAYVSYVSGISGTLDLREQYGLVRCLFEVIIGVGLYRVYASFQAHKENGPNRESRMTERTWDTVALFFFVGIFVSFALGLPDLFMVPLAGGLILSLSLSRGFFTRVLEWRPLVFLGTISFSIYMIHAFVLFFCLELSRFSQSHLGFWSGAACFVAAYLSIIGISYLTYSLIERKAHRGLMRIESRFVGKQKVEYDRASRRYAKS